MDYAKALRDVRLEVGLSKRHLAQLIGCDASYVTHLESGRRKPSLETLELLSNALEIPVHVFALRAATEQDLRGVSPKKAQRLAVLLTKAFRHARRRSTTA